MQKQAPSLGRILLAAGFTLSCFGLILYLWIAFGGPVPLASESYRITAYFPEATALYPQADVRIGGVSVGTVRSVDLAPPEIRVNGKDTTEAVLEIRPRFAPIASDARAIMRQKTLQGEVYVELTSGTEPSGGPAPVSLGAAATVSDADRAAVEPIEENGTLGIGQVKEATQFDEILNAFDERTRATGRRLLASSARALRGRGDDFSAALGNAAPFLRQAARITSTVRAQRRPLQGLIRDSGLVFAALSADDRELQGAVRGADATFRALADARDPLASTIAILPVFEHEARLTLDRVDELGALARPVVRKLVPVAGDVSPTLRSLRRAAPPLRGLLGDVRPLIGAAREGLPALRDTLAQLMPAFDALDPFLANLNPVLGFLRAYRERVATFIANPPIGLAGTLPPIPGQPTPRHALRVLPYLSQESLSAYPVRLNTNRGNGYFRPDGYLEGLDTLTLPSFDCRNPDYTSTAQDSDQDERYFNDGGDPKVGYDFMGCSVANPFPGMFGGGQAPTVYADP